MVKRPTTKSQNGPPYVGAMLRLAWQRARQRIDETMRTEGFDDLQDSHLPILSWPPPDGIRLSELARRIRMSRQATNYLVGQLEELGYLERRAAPGTERRLIHLTKRGRSLMTRIQASMRDLQADWAQQVGQQRFDTFMDVLRQLHAAPQMEFGAEKPG